MGRSNETMRMKPSWMGSVTLWGENEIVLYFSLCFSPSFLTPFYSLHPSHLNLSLPFLSMHLPFSLCTYSKNLSIYYPEDDLLPGIKLARSWTLTFSFQKISIFCVTYLAYDIFVIRSWQKQNYYKNPNVMPKIP